jgi:ABC-type glycerol-3-phosphate transport system substrate-binding protein
MAYRSIRVLALVAVLVVGAGAAFAAGASQAAVTGDGVIPEIHRYEAAITAAGAELGSDPTVVAAVQDYVASQIGVRPVTHFLPAQEYSTALNLILSSGDQIDWFLAGNWSDYSRTNVIQPINDYLQYAPTMVETWPESSWNAATDAQGRIWAMPRAVPTTPWYVHVRKDWLDRLGLDMPTTIAELENVMSEFRRARLNGDATVVTLFSNGPVALRDVFLANWAEYGNSMFLDTDGRVKPVVLAPGFGEWLDTMASWYQLGYLDQESFVNPGATRSRFQQLQPGIYTGWYSHYSISHPILQTNAPEADYQIAHIRSPRGTGTQSVSGAKPLNGQVFHRANVDMAATMRLIEWFYLSGENYLIGEMGLPDEQWRWVDESKGIYELIGSRVFFNDFRYSVGLPMEAKVMALGGIEMHNFYLRNRLMEYDEAVFPWDTEYYWDQSGIRDNIPGLADINRLIDEEVTKFIMGARPLNQFNAFVEELNSAGLQQWIAEYTRQYNALK